MTEETRKGAWVWRTTIGGEVDSKWEKHWDPEATPMSEEEADAKYRRLLELLFAPKPDDGR
ncbi:hypothetical protein [Streptomyces abikoensis]|uniref:Uncharacterized protein n=1 Tax=Streptomyces abikoensis TaxID=97398 RepID=A0ABW7TDS3_9ACTN